LEIVQLMKYGAFFFAICSATARPAVADTVSEARDVFSSFSQCTVQHRAKEAAEVVLADDSNDEILRKHPDLLTGDCLGLEGGTLQIPSSDFVRYGLAEALVRRQYARGLPPDISLAAPLRHREINQTDYQPKPGKTPKPTELANLQKRRERDAGERLLSIYGECVVRTDPVAALRLIMTKVDSPGESQAFADMNAALSKCLASGERLQFGKAALRGSVAMNLYRLANAPRVEADAAPAK
jgi:hypothetical protein